MWSKILIENLGEASAKAESKIDTTNIIEVSKQMLITLFESSDLSRETFTYPSWVSTLILNETKIKDNNIMETQTETNILETEFIMDWALLTLSIPLKENTSKETLIKEI